MNRYKIINEKVVQRDDGAFIPSDNPDYKAYLDWVSAGNTPETEEEVPQIPAWLKNRTANYPPTDQALNALWDLMASQKMPKAELWFSECLEVKNKYPKD